MKRVILAASLAAIGTVLHAQPTGYATNGTGQVHVTNPYGLCWRTGFWQPGLATAPCDVVPRAAQPAPVVSAPPPPPEPVAQAPAPEPTPLTPPAPEPAPIAAPTPPPIEKVSLSADVLFEFNKAELREEGKKQLDALNDRLKDAQVDEIVAVGHADRIGADTYNQKLSEKRAEAVKEYLQQTAATKNIQTAGKGEAEPITGDACKGVKAGRKLVQCLQPDRRVEIEVFGSRQAAGGTAPAAAGASR